MSALVSSGTIGEKSVKFYKNVTFWVPYNRSG
jgi:hypothetical protein